MIYSGAVTTSAEPVAPYLPPHPPTEVQNSTNLCVFSDFIPFFRTTVYILGSR